MQYEPCQKFSYGLRGEWEYSQNINVFLYHIGFKTLHILHNYPKIHTVFRR